MPPVTFLLLVLALGICFIPVWLLRRSDHGRAQDRFVSSQYTRPDVVRNASIAYALRMAAFGPLLAWGASGDLWPAVIGAAFLGSGVYLIYVLRLPLLVFLHGALSRDRSITVHAFMERQHGNDPRVRLLAASLTVFAVLGLLVGEALGVAALLEPVLPGSAAAVHVLAVGALLLTVLPAMLSGHSGVMHSAQLQLGMLYFGLFGSTALLLYLHLSALTPMPPHATFAVVFVAVCCAVMLYYRRSKYVDTTPIRSDPANADPGRGARLLSRFQKVLNPCISVFAVLTVVMAFAVLYVAGPPTIVRHSAAALEAGTRVPGVGLLALCLLPLVYPLVDVASWQAFAAVAKDLGSSGVEPGGRSALLRGVFRTCAAESALVWLFICMLGAIAVSAIGTPGGADAPQAIVSQLVAADNEVTAIASALLLICVFAAALSTMSVLFSASLCTIRYDLLAVLWPELAPGEGQWSKEATAMGRTLVAGGGLGLAFAAAFWVADAWLPVRFTSSTFLALLFAILCAQLSFVPLVLGPIVGRKPGGLGTVSPGWALAILGSGAASGAAAVTVYLATGTETWLWAAVPTCLGSGLVLYAIARRRGQPVAA